MQVVTGASGHPGRPPRSSTTAASGFGFMESDVSSRSRRRCWSARSPTGCARPRPTARRCSGSAARASCTPAPRRPWSRWSRPASSTSSSPATRWPPTTSSRRSTARRSASTWPRAAASSTATSTTSGRSTRSARQGSIRAAVDSGVLTGGIMHALVTHDKEFVLVGSVRDDGPLPDVYTDVIEGQRAMRGRAHRRRLLPDGRDHAALGRDRQHPARPRSRWSASTSTRRRSPSWPTAARRRRAASSPTSACSSSSSPRELVPDYRRP